ncbi:MAG: glycosyltransferase family 4 protein [Leptospiraceae bacterium]|nr:glycosyltransferase family 4 protein [Leptospiraceae bacterium]MCP5498773.1 glycosyltransferase family 4 protein [Leptospiraceae bacterium]
MNKGTIALITPRFHDRLAGGAERLSYEYARILSKNYNVVILTTCATDYITWKNELPIPEASFAFGRILRFQTLKERNILQFNKLDKNLKEQLPYISEADENSWLKEQGPYVPSLIEHIIKNEEKYEVFIFFTYLYYPTVRGLSLIRDKSICVPALHDETHAYFPMFKSLFKNDLVYGFNTEEEYSLFSRLYNFKPQKFSIIGTGLDLNKKKITTNSFTFPYVLYLGRIDSSKGIYELCKFFLNWKTKYSKEVKLLICGSGDFQNPSSDHIEFYGFVDEEKKEEILNSCLFLINPSRLESLSYVLLESWAHSKPVLVNALSPVLRNQCKKSKAGLFYDSQENFNRCMNILLEDEKLRISLGSNGYEYIVKNYSDSAIEEKLNYLIQTTIRN